VLKAQLQSCANHKFIVAVGACLQQRIDPFQNGDGTTRMDAS
jgi:hypothetical protein